MECEYIETARLRLRKVTPSVMNYVHTHYNDKELSDFFGITNEIDLQKEKDRFAGGYETFNRKFCIFHLISKETGQMIGSCNFHVWYIEHFRAEIGYAITLEEEKRKGYMTEAVKAVIDYGFNEMKLTRIEVMARPDNVPSVKIIHNMGFVQEGLLRKHYYVNGIPEDTAIFALLKEEYGKQ